MTKKNQVIFEVDDGRAIIKAWLLDSSSNPDEYLTKNGQSYLNGFLQANNTMKLIKIEKYDELTNKYEELINKYEKDVKYLNKDCHILGDDITILSEENKKLKQIISKLKKNKKIWWKNLKWW